VEGLLQLIVRPLDEMAWNSEATGVKIETKGPWAVQSFGQKIKWLRTHLRPDSP